MTAMVATVVVPFLTTKLPVPALTASLKVNTKLAPTATPVAPSVGEILESVGAVVSVIDSFSTTKYNKFDPIRSFHSPASP